MADKVDIFMPLFVADYLADTTDLTAEEHGAYILLLMASWRQGGQLENNPHRLARTAKVPADRWADVWSAIERFFDVTSDAIVQGRLVKELEKAQVRRAVAALNGARGAAARWPGHGKAIRTPLANGTPENGSSPSPSDPDLSLSGSPSLVPVASDPDPEARAIPLPQAPYVPPRERPRVDRFAAATSAAFDRVFKAYPRKDAKVRAQDAFAVAATLTPGGEDALAEAILAALPAMLKRHPYNGPNDTRPFLETVLAERRWEDPESAPDDLPVAATGPPFGRQPSTATRNAFAAILATEKPA